MLKYDTGRGRLKNWLVEDSDFAICCLGKTEAIMALGNGYLGLRSTHEETYAGQTRGLFVAGTFNRPAGEDVPELPNLPDIVNIDILIDGRPFSLELGKHSGYRKQLNLKTGELVRRFRWESPEKKRFDFRFERFVSQKDIHLIGARVTIHAYDEANVVVESGIDGRITNSGAAHFGPPELRVTNGRILSYAAETTESGIGIAISSAHRFLRNGQLRAQEDEICTQRRGLRLRVRAALMVGDALTIEKISIIATTRDKDAEADYERLVARCCCDAAQAGSRGYRELFQESATVLDQYWKRVGIQIDSSEGFDQLAIRFAQYHMKAMAPAHDARMGIGAKGLTGEEYKGHSFWDTEVFLLPYYMLVLPEVAKSLLLYRFHGLAGAREKARQNGFEGAMYPWEAAWIDDSETTPPWGEIDAVTGERSRIWCGLLEQHITADVAYAINAYHTITGDDRFMDDYGYEVILSAALFWSSRLVWDAANQRFDIRNVIGPDEYKEHVDNNAYTNYMAKNTMDLALAIYDRLHTENPELLARLEEKLSFAEKRDLLERRSALLFLPLPNADGVIAQDATYLEKPEIDLAAYRDHKRVRSILKKYNVGQLSNLQVTKQADVLLLLYLNDGLFAPEVKRANWDYYEPRTLHDSSLSLAIHSIVACDIGECDMAYRMFRQAAEIDLGSNMESSDNGIHAAAMGGVWQCVVNGFAGLRIVGDGVVTRPRLPAHWQSVSIPLTVRGKPMILRATREEFLFCSPEN